MATAFQSNAFQTNAFQIDAIVVELDHDGGRREAKRYRRLRQRLRADLEHAFQTHLEPQRPAEVVQALHVMEPYIERGVPDWPRLEEALAREAEVLQAVNRFIAWQQREEDEADVAMLLTH